MTFNKINTVLLDGDGVLYHGDRPVPGLSQFFEMLFDYGIHWGLVTNNSTRTVEHFITKLAGFGISIAEDQIITSATATAAYLLDNLEPGASIYAISEHGLVDTLSAAGFRVFNGSISPDDEVAAVITALDRNFTYHKAAIAMRLIREQNALFIATNPDRTIPLETGLAPGAGMVNAAVRATVDREPIVIGKPQPQIFKTALHRLNASPETTIMVGDRLETDILGAQAVGIRTVLLLSGVATREELAVSEIQPDRIHDSLADLTQAILSEHQP